jgi:hypothetical protein
MVIQLSHITDYYYISEEENQICTCHCFLKCSKNYLSNYDKNFNFLKHEIHGKNMYAWSYSKNYFIKTLTSLPLSLVNLLKHEINFKNPYES